MELTYKKLAFSSVHFAWLVRWWCLPIVLGVFALLLLSAFYLLSFPYIGARWNLRTGKVTQVYDNSPAARIGLSVGDVIQTVDGVPFESAYQPLSSKKVEEEALLTWEHEGSNLKGIMPIVKKPAWVQLKEIVPSTIGLLLCLMGVVVMALRPTIVAARFFFLLNQLGAATLAVGLLCQHGFDKADWLFNLFVVTTAALFVHTMLHIHEGERLIPLSSKHDSALAGNSRLACFMLLHRQPIATWQLLAEESLSLTAQERRLCKSWLLCVPLGCQGRLFGLLFLGRKRGSEPYTQADHHMLSTLATEATMTTHNISLALSERLQQIEASRRELQEASLSPLIIREEERKRLAHDLHDGAIQKLSQLAAQLDKTIQQIDNPALLTTLQEIRAKSGKSINELRALCDDLRPPEVEFFGLACAIESDAQELTGKATIRLELSDEKKKLSLDASYALYRIYQAAITNAQLHAQAQEIKVLLHFCEQTAKLTIQDDGQGFVVPERLMTLAQNKHFGLVGMQERAWALGGDLTIDSTLGVGTTIRVVIPLERNKK